LPRNETQSTDGTVIKGLSSPWRLKTIWQRAAQHGAKSHLIKPTSRPSRYELLDVRRIEQGRHQNNTAAIDLSHTIGPMMTTI